MNSLSNFKPMMILYAYPLSNYCNKVAIVLALKQVPHEVQTPPDGYGSEAYKQLVPSGKIPGLADGDLILSESEAINEYLNERFPEPNLLPGDAGQRARLRMLSRQHDLAVELPIRAMFRQVSPATRDPEAVKKHEAELQKQLQVLAQLADPQPFLGTPEISLADAAYAPTLVLGRMVWEAVGLEWTLPDALAPWQQTLLAHPTVAEVLVPARQAAEQWLSKKLAA